MSAKKKAAKKPAARRRKDLNWPVIKREWVSGQLSLEELAKEHGTTKQNISQMAKKYKWPPRQGMQERIRERTQEMLIDAGLTTEGVEVAAARGAQVVREHRAQLEDLRSVVKTLTDEMVRVLNEKPPGKGASKAEIIAYFRAKNSVTVTLKTCTDSVAKLIPLERQAFNIDAGTTDDDLESLLRKLNAE